MSEAKGPYRTGYERGYYTVIDGSGVVVYSDSEVSGVNMFTDAANYAHHHALAAQAERVRQLEEALIAARWFVDILESYHDGQLPESDFEREVAEYKGTLSTTAALTPPAKGGT